MFKYYLGNTFRWREIEKARRDIKRKLSKNISLALETQTSPGAHVRTLFFFFSHLETTGCLWHPHASQALGNVVSSLQPHGLYIPWNSPGQKTGVGSLSLLQSIFPTQGSNPGLPHCRKILYQLSHKGSPKYLIWPCSILKKRGRQQ